MPEARWRVYPTGLAGSAVRAIGSALMGIPLVALLMLLPFLMVRQVAALGALGQGETGLAWWAWADVAVGVSVLALAVLPLVVSLLHYLRTVLLLHGLRRAARTGAPSLQVPHPGQWHRATQWSGASLVVSALVATAVLAFPVVLTRDVRAWVEALPITQDWRLVGVPVIAISLTSLLQPRRKRALAELERRWPERARQDAEAAARARVPDPVRDRDGDPVNPMQVQRRPLDELGDRLNTVAVVISVVAVPVGMATLAIADTTLGHGAVPSPAESLLLCSSLLLVALAIVLLITGAVQQGIAQTAERRELFAAAVDPAAGPPPIGVIARHWSATDVPWVNLLGLLGALVLLVAVPARLVSAPWLQGWGAAGLVLAVVLLVVAVLVDVVAEQRSRQPRTLMLRRWPTPGPGVMAKYTKEQASAALAADVQRYASGNDGPSRSAAAPVTNGAAAPVTGGATPPVGGHRPPPPEGQAPPSARGARPGWGLPKKLRGRRIGDLYR